MKETDLYHPIKRFFEESGYEVKAEITDCDIVAIKEASGDLMQIMEIIKNKPADFHVLSGDDALTLPSISVGVEGVISVLQTHCLSNFQIW